MPSAGARAWMALARAAAAKAAPTAPTAPPAFNPPTPPDQDVLDALTRFYASRDAIAATQLPDALLARVQALGIPAEAAAQAGRLGCSPRMSGRSRHGAPTARAAMSAARRVASEEPGMRARYTLAAARRLAAGLGGGDWAAALARERGFQQAHIAAGQNRRRAARNLDRVASEQGPLLVWKTRQDAKVSFDCSLLEGRIFTADDPPDGQIPGAVHPRCRCWSQGWPPSRFQP